jgi:hypothetical protein
VARKIFQDFAHVFCQRFIEVPSPLDLVNLYILDVGRLDFDILAARARFNDYPVDPFPCMCKARLWLEERLVSENIPRSELIGATLKVTFRTTVDRSRLPFPSAKFNLACESQIVSPDRSYAASIEAEKAWGISPISMSTANI